MNKIKPVLIALAVCFAAVIVCACGRELPPDDGTPAPAAPSGVYSCDLGSLTFNGDGKSVVIDFTDEFAEKSGLPSGRREGTYVFLFRNEQWRCDKAETFRITIGGEKYQFRNGIGITGKDRIAVYFDGETEAAVFTKTGD